MKRRDPSTSAPLVDLMQPKAVDLPPTKGRTMRVAGLFAGIGGVELGLGRSGHRTTLLCEIEPGARAVLATRFPNSPLHDDVCTLPELGSDVDLVTAGFPCQDLSQAGKTTGIEGSRSGLVGEVFRLLRSRRTPWVLLENVPFMLQLSRGRAMEVIVATMEDLGYRWAYRVVNTRSFGLPQRRERVLFLASVEGDPRDVLFADEAPEPTLPEPAIGHYPCGFYWTEGIRGLGWAVDAVPTLKGGSTIGIPSPPAILMPDGEVVTPDIRDAERMQGFDADWTSPALAVTKRGHRWKLVGNAVTVDVAAWVGARLLNPSPVGRDTPGVPIAKAGAWPRAAWNVGNGRFSAQISAFPVQSDQCGLATFLKHPTKPLSEKATNGFLSRAAQGSLRFPPGFLDALSRHLKRQRLTETMAA